MPALGASWTLDVWYKDTSTTANHDWTYLLMAGATDTNGEAPLYVETGWGGFVCAGTRHAWTSAAVCTTNNSVNVWHHLVVSVTGTTMTLSVDGLTNSGIVPVGAANGLPLTVGVNPPGHGPWRGAIAQDARVNGLTVLTGATLLGGATLSTDSHP